MKKYDKKDNIKLSKNEKNTDKKSTIKESFGNKIQKRYIELYGYQMVLLWLTVFFIVFYPFIVKLNTIDKTIIYWCLITIFVFIFEMMFMIKYKYVCDKGNYYYNHRPPDDENNSGYCF